MSLQALPKDIIRQKVAPHLDGHDLIRLSGACRETRMALRPSAEWDDGRMGTCYRLANCTQVERITRHKMLRVATRTYIGLDHLFEQ
jgi:hypothetical protein